MQGDLTTLQLTIVDYFVELLFNLPFVPGGCIICQTLVTFFGVNIYKYGQPVVYHFKPCFRQKPAIALAIINVKPPNSISFIGIQISLFQIGIEKALLEIKQNHMPILFESSIHPK